MSKRWIIYCGTEILGYYAQDALPPVDAGCVGMELSEVDDGVSEWYFHDDYGLIMEGTEPSEEEGEVLLPVENAAE